MVAAVLLLPAGSTPLIHFHQTLSSNFLTREMLAGLSGLKRASTLKKAFLPYHKCNRPLCFIYFSSCVHPPVPNGSAGCCWKTGGVGMLTLSSTPGVWGTGSSVAMQNMGIPLKRCLWSVVFPRGGSRHLPHAMGCQCAQGAGPAWHRDCGRSLGRGSILTALSH